VTTAEVGLTPYLVRVVLALTVMIIGVIVFVGLAKNKGWVRRNAAHVKIMASLPLGKDVFFVLRCGPEVFALTSGHAGTHLLGRWKYEEWLRSEGMGNGMGGKDDKKGMDEEGMDEEDVAEKEMDEKDIDWEGLDFDGKETGFPR
jgi:hypothetical protein